MASVLFIPVIFVCATALLFTISTNAPDIDCSTTNCSRNDLKFPKNLEELSALATLLQTYKAEHVHYVMLLFCCAYLYKQTFAIPGSVFMNVLAGAIFSPWLAFPLVCLLTASGATCCFLLSKFFGRQLLLKHFKKKVLFMQKKVEDNVESLLFFLLFLRFFPMSPNWFLNMASPIVNIPIHLFFSSVFIGLMPYIVGDPRVVASYLQPVGHFTRICLMPYNFICVQTGGMLSTLRSLDDILTAGTMLKLAAVAFMALVPGLVMQRLKKGRIKTE